MPSFLEDNLKQHCSGCGACAQACGVNAIKLEADEEGFIYPVIDKSKCVECNKCVSVCPFFKNERNTGMQEYFGAKSKDSSVIKSSTSGGAFYEIAKAFCDENYVIFGVEMSENLQVHHISIDDFSDIGKLQKSKYVQSNTENSFKEVKKCLKENKKVMFTGTPCQVAGLKNFLGKDYENLVTVDIVCHGVPSQALFDKYISELSQKMGSKVVFFTFRNKNNFEKEKCDKKTVLVKTESGKEKVKEVLQCEYLAAFHKVLFYRPSCGECPFANTDRVSDITIADFWGAENYYKDFDDGKGISLVITNTEKGKALFEKTDMDIIKTDREKAIAQNDQLNYPVKFHKNREKFFELNKKKSFCDSVKVCINFPSPLHYKLYKLKVRIKKLLK